MNNILYKFFAAIIILSVTTGCTKDDMVSGEGQLRVDVATDTKTIVVNTYANTETIPQYTLRIKNMDGETVRRYDNIPPNGVIIENWLLAAKYKAEVTAGTNPIAAFNSPYYYGEKEVTIKPNVITDASVVCRLANAKVSVVYTDRFRSHFDEFSTVVGSAKGNLTFGKENSESGFFRVESDINNNLTWKINLTNLAGTSFEKEGVITDYKARNHYTITFDMEAGSEDGGKFVPTITVDDDAIQTDTDVNIPMKRLPEINGVGFDIKDPFFIALGTSTSVKVEIKGMPKITSAKVRHDCAYLTQNSIPTEFELIGMNNNSMTALNNLGIYVTINENQDNIIMDFGEISNKLVNGDYKFNYEITDSYNKKSTKTLNLLVMESEVMTIVTTNAIRDNWATSLVVWGKWVSDAKPENLGFDYRKSGESNWSDVTSELIIDDQGKTFSAKITGLTPNSVYEYRTKYGAIIANTQSAKTDVATALPNGGFETWKDGNTPYTDQVRFWDTGNNTFAQMTKRSDDRVEGNFAAKMVSEWATIKFAAGNIYAGKFINLNLGTQVVDLEFGYPYTARPTKFSFSYKYLPNKVNRGEYAGMNGKMDNCIIYALLTDRGSTYKIKSNDESSFINIANDNSIIAYGEFISDQTTDTYTLETVDLGYRSLTRKPTHIIIVASASRYGDYFTGGEGSTLFLDDFELIFE